ncbi:MAG: glycosyltransferase family 4 protein [Lachnospiraceae bacterium]|nr:glycosyltransferase family 4 protein [Lachnospiraceae bacterium]
MNVLFLTLIDVESIEERNIYTDLLREFVKNGHRIYLISPVERRKKQNTYLISEFNSIILKLKIGNIQKTNIIEKGISTISIESRFIMGIKKYFKNVRFDLVLYSTPPITVFKVVEYIKKRDSARTYLLLKDIFPQNALDIGLLSKSGLKGVLYKYFRKREKKLYAISDRIGCMSEANVAYILKHNPEITSAKIEVCPNSIEPIDMSISIQEKMAIRDKYNIPQDKIVFIYGGNLGKPQGIDFMLQCLQSQKFNESVFFTIVGNGTEYMHIQNYIKKNDLANVCLHQWLPKDDYNKVVASCDIGLIFLDYRFSIPNFPSRLLSYMNARLPVFAVTDIATDIGKLIVEKKFGWWCESNNVEKFSKKVGEINIINKSMGNLAYRILVKEFNVKNTYKIIMKNNLANIENK